MPMRDRICRECGWAKADNFEPRTTMDVLCPNGHKTEIVYVGASAAIHGDDKFLGGVTYENMGHEPVTVFSRAERRRAMEARGLMEFVRHAPKQGTDKSPHTTNWATVSKETLTNAAELIRRVSGE